MQAILFAFLAITSCVYAAPREQSSRGSGSLWARFGRPFYHPSVIDPFYPFYSIYYPRMSSSWSWPSKEDIEEMYEEIHEEIQKNAPWHMGPNVCNITRCFETPNNEEVTGALKEMEESSDDFFRGFFGFSSESSEEWCKGDRGNYTCWERKMTRTGVTTKVINFFCCEGYELAKDPQTNKWLPGCRECSEPKNEEESQIPLNEEPEEVTDSTLDWKNRMEYSFLSHGDRYHDPQNRKDDFFPQ